MFLSGFGIRVSRWRRTATHPGRWSVSQRDRGPESDETDPRGFVLPPRPEYSPLGLKTTKFVIVN